MANTDIELKTLKPRQRKFIDLIVYKGLSRVEAYCEAFGKDIATSNPDTLRSSATKQFYQPHVNNYYHACMEEIRDNEIKKGVWTKEVATEKLVKLVERAERDIYGDDDHNETPITMSKLQAIMQPIKELNQMNGFNETNVNFDGSIVQIYGEGELKD